MADITLRVNGSEKESHRLSRNTAALGSSGHAATDRHKIRLRRRTVRRLHRARGGQSDPFLLDAGLAGCQ